MKRAIMDMSNKVLEHIATKYDNVREGVKSVMGGKILDYEAKTIFEEGRSQGELYQIIRMVRRRIIQFSILFLDLSLFFREWQAGRPAIFWASGFYSL